MDFKTAQEIQDEIFRKMPAEKKVRLALEFSDFCSKLHKIGKHGKRKIIDKNKSDFRKP